MRTSSPAPLPPKWRADVATEVPPLLQKWLDKLDQDSIQHTGGLQYKARCPSHDDDHASLSVSWGEKGKVVATCHANCELSDIVEALGLTKRDLEPERKEVAVYRYCDEDDELAYEVVRFDPKEFRQRRPDPEHKGRHTWNLHGVEPIPYNLPEVAELVEHGDEESVLWIVEGEKDVHALQDAYSAIATCNSGGAGRWTDGHSKYLIGFKGQIIIVADDDDKPTKPGQKHALEVYESLERVAGITAQLAYPLEGKDAAEHVSNHDAEDFVPLTPDQLRAEIAYAAKDAPSEEDQREAKVEEAAEHMRVQREARALLAADDWEAPPVQGSWAEQLLEPEEPIQWLIPDLAFEGANVVVNAQAKSGKTTLILNVAHSLLGGDPLFGHFPVSALATGRSVAWWNAELSERQAKAWLRNFDLPRPDDFHPQHLRGFAMPFDSVVVEEWAVAWLKDRGVSVWLIDPLSALFSGDENSNTEVGAWLAAIDRIKRRAGVETVFLVHHVAETAAAEESDNPNAGRLLKGRGASRLSGWGDVLWSYAGRFDEPRYLSALGRDVDMDRFGGLSMDSGSRLLRFSGQRSTPTIDRRNDLALKAVDFVTEHDGPIRAGELQALLPGAKADPKRRAIEFAVQQGWLAKEDGPGNSTLYSLGERDPRLLKLSLNIVHQTTERD
jgi:hypothetical protein